MTTDNDTYDKIVAGNIAAARARTRMSQKAVAERMEALGYGWRQQTVAAIEGGRRGLAVGEVLGLACALETSAWALLDLDGKPRVSLPSGQAIDARWVLRFNGNGTVIQWDGAVPHFRPPVSQMTAADLDRARANMLSRQNVTAKERAAFDKAYDTLRPLLDSGLTIFDLFGTLPG